MGSRLSSRGSLVFASILLLSTRNCFGNQQRNNGEFVMVVSSFLAKIKNHQSCLKWPSCILLAPSKESIIPRWWNPQQCCLYATEDSKSKILLGITPSSVSAAIVLSFQNYPKYVLKMRFFTKSDRIWRHWPPRKCVFSSSFTFPQNPLFLGSDGSRLPSNALIYRQIIWKCIFRSDQAKHRKCGQLNNFSLIEFCFCFNSFKWSPASSSMSDLLWTLILHHFKTMEGQWGIITAHFKNHQVSSVTCQIRMLLPFHCAQKHNSPQITWRSAWTDCKNGAE